jgi:hypothetical protein
LDGLRPTLHHYYSFILVCMHSFILVPQLFIHIQQLILPDVPAWSHPLKILRKNYSSSSQQQNLAQILVRNIYKGLFGLKLLKFNSHYINILSNAWSTKCRLIACMSAQIRSNLRDESIKPN